uniref:Speriolin C-terminal domain-containing protein n=1 Tax=Chelonoidis abingdonii TaxID=106734 RepID=A0A8C0J9B7_CHEAB
MTDDNEWMKTIQNENAYLKNQVRLLRENYELRSLLSQHYENSNEGQIITSHPAPVYPNACSPRRGKENLEDLSSTLSSPKAQAEVTFKGIPNNPTLFQPTPKERKPILLSSTSWTTRVEKQLPETIDLSRLKKVCFTDVTSPGGDKPRKPHTYYLNELELNSKKNGRIVGEIAFQLDRRILAYVFPGVTRLYGYTVSNIPEKIKQASMKCLNGSMDEKKHRAMMQRYLSLTARLEKIGYNPDVHPVFSEFLINTYGILKQRPDVHSSPLHSSPADLRKVVIDIVPSKFLGDTLLLLNCLCELSKEDSKPLFAW